MLNIPKDMKRRNPWPLIIMMGIAVISFILAGNTLMGVASGIAAPVGISG